MHFKSLDFYQLHLNLQDLVKELSYEVFCKYKAETKKILSDQGKDIKLKADIEMHRLLTNKLTEVLNVPILSEEGEAKLVDDLQWVIDPLDGSFNYNSDLPTFAVSVALCHGHDPILGCIYDPSHNDCYIGSQQLGAFKNEKPIRSSSKTSIATCSLSTGFPLGMDMSDSNLTKFINNVRKFKKIRMLGSAAMSLANVAKGSLDVYYEQDIFLWDVAAGLVLSKAAGAQVHVLPGSQNFKLNVLVGPSRIEGLKETFFI